MRFYNREGEAELLRKYGRVVVIGRRRVGKTRLVEETFKEKCIALFVAEKKERLVCKDWLEEVRKSGIYIPELTSMKDVVEYLLNMKDDRVIFIDEFQNLLKVNKGFISDLQRLLDKYRERRVVVSGSMISMTKKLVENYKSPVYGRFDTVLKLGELDFRTVAEICRDLGYSAEDAVALYSVFGGIPKYYETLGKVKGDPLEFISSMFFEDPYPLVEEVRVMLREEFGKEFKTFFSILEAIANSANTFGEIAGYIGEEATKVTKYIYLLERDYEVIEKRESIVGKGKRIYAITSNLLDFWFKFVWKFYPDVLGRGEEAKRNFITNAGKFVGLKFEGVAKEIVRLPFKPDRVGRWWGAYRDRKGGERRTAEIDLVALSEASREIAFFEVKWGRLTERDALRILKSLKERSRLVDWHLEDRRAYFGVVTREIEGKERLREEGYLAFDLEDELA